jgi:hypothetical protein
MNILHREKIDCFATFIIPPEWDKQDFQKMVYTVKSLGIHFVNLQPLTPLPGTSVSISENWIIIDRKSYEKWDLAHISVQPVKLSVSEFYSEILKAYHSILYRPGVIWKYLMNYKPAMLYKMFMGGFRVTMQYRKKIKESREYA